MQKFYLEPLPLDVQLLKLFISLRADASTAHLVPHGTLDPDQTKASAPPMAALIHTHRINFPDFEFIEPPNKRQGFLARQVSICDCARGFEVIVWYAAVGTQFMLTSS